MMKLKTMALVLVAGWLAGCAAADDRPSTMREVCQENAVVDCAVDARRDVCAGRAAEDTATCETEYVDACCAIAQDCDAAPTTKYATFSEFEACQAAVMDMSCTAVEAGDHPKACAGVVK